MNGPYRPLTVWREKSPDARALPLRVDEEDVQAKCWELLQRVGATTWWLSQARYTGQTKGLPDLLTFTAQGHMAWIECKRPETDTQRGGKQRPDQRRFEANCKRCGETYLVIDHPQQLADWLGKGQHHVAIR
jgi:VRR-NUC domain